MEVSTVIWMFVVLKLPILAAMWLIWYAVQAPEPDTGENDERGGSDRDPGPRPRRPRPPRRGPHGAPPPPAPRRVRTRTGRGVRHTPR